mgnify:CR=1 FL=1
MTIEDKHTLDLSALAILAAVLGNVLPSIVSVLSAIWIAIRVYETDTVQKWLGRK